MSGLDSLPPKGIAVGATRHFHPRHTYFVGRQGRQVGTYCKGELGPCPRGARARNGKPPETPAVRKTCRAIIPASRGRRRRARTRPPYSTIQIARANRRWHENLRTARGRDDTLEIQPPFMSSPWWIQRYPHIGTVLFQGTGMKDGSETESRGRP